MEVMVLFLGKLRSLSFTLALLALGVMSGLLFLDALLGPTGPLVTVRLRAMGDYDYVADAEEMMAQGREEEALRLLRYVDSNGLPGQERARELVSRIEEQRSGLLARASRFLRGFILGEGESLEEVTASILSDMTLYGDVRDLVKQGYYKLAGEDSDPLVATLAALGLATELFDAVDWAPALMKAAREAGSLTDAFADWLLGAGRRSLEARRLEPALEAVLGDLKAVRQGQGVQGTLKVLRHVDDPKDLRGVARFSRWIPDEAYVLMVLGGDDGIRLLKNLPESPRSAEVIRLAVRKGPAGIGLLLKPTPRISRVIKTLRLGGVSDLVSALAEGSRWWLLAPLAVSVLCLLWGYRRLRRGAA